MSSVVIIDYGMGNLHSIAKAIQQAGPDVSVTLTDKPALILQAERVVLPGVGAIRDCMNALHERNLIESISVAAASKPFLGICLGMQALLDQSEENEGTSCLGIIPGAVLRFPEHRTDTEGRLLKIPQMGWNRVYPTREHPLWQGIAPGSWFYFVHSYYVSPDLPEDIAATTEYLTPFASAITHGTVFATQFHPEKSQAAGLRLLSNFLNWTID